MSHLDDGTLHAYLDGELSTVERARVEAHLAECEPCRERLVEERSLIERADRLLGLATPSGLGLSVPTALRRRRRWRVPSAWAASIAAAFIGGWLLRPGSPPPSVSRTAEVRDAAAPPAPQFAVADESGGRSANAERRQTSAPRRSPAPVPADTEATATTGGIAAREEQPAVRITPGVVPATSQPALRGAAAAPEPAAKVAVAQAPAPMLSRQALALGPHGEIGTSWPAITAAPARSLLGADVVKIPGLPVRDIRQDPRMNGQVVVDQEVADGVVIQLLQGRSDLYGITAADSVGRSSGMSLVYESSLKRNVGPLWVRISGPLSNDSLLKLLQLAR